MEDIIIGDLEEQSNGAYFLQSWYRKDTGPAGKRVLLKQDCVSGECSVSLVTGDDDTLEVLEANEGLQIYQTREHIERLVATL